MAQKRYADGCFKWQATVLCILMCLFIAPVAHSQDGGYDAAATRVALKKQKEKEREEREKKQRREELKKQKESAQHKSNKGGKVDTFDVVHDLMNHRKYRPAVKLLERYKQNHPTEMNALWLEAQAQLWLSNFKKSDALYKSAMKLQPKNDYLRLNYIHGLMAMGKTDSATTYLDNMERSGSDYPDMAYLRAQILYWNGDYPQASAYINQAMELDGANQANHDLSDEIIAATAPKLTLASGYLSDNQPYRSIASSIRYDQTFSRLLAPFVEIDEYHFIQPGVFDAPLGKLGDKLSFPKIGMEVTIGAGAYQYPAKGGTGFTGLLHINKKISPSFDVEVSGEQAPYFDTKSSIDTNISSTRVSGVLNWHRRKWLGKAAYLQSFYAGNDYVYSAYGWIMAPVATMKHGQLNIGYSAGYSNSNISSYTSTQPLSEILASGNANASISGLYNPFFTPDKQLINAAIASLNLELSPKIGLNVNCDIGVGRIDNPYLYLDNKEIVRGFQYENFTPSDLLLTLSYHVSKSCVISGKYIYRSTYFFASNYGGIEISKSFWHSREMVKGNDSANGYMKQVGGIQQHIQWLYSAKDPETLRGSVQKIKDEIETLRDEQSNRLSNSEILPNGAKAARLHDRIDALNNMADDLDNVDLNDLDANASRKTVKQWLVEKLYQLNLVHYDDSYGE